jgi:hypothetical protein
VNKVAFVRNADGGEFAVVIEGDGGVDAVGLSPHGKEWAAWVDSLPFRQRRLASDVLWSLSEAQHVDGPRVPTRAERADIGAILSGQQTTTAT